MKKFTGVCLAVAAVLVILGITACAAGVIMGAGSANIREVLSSGRLEGWKWFDNDVDWTDSEYKEGWKDARESVQTFPAKDIHKIEISLRHGGLEIVESDTDEISVMLEKDTGWFQVSSENGTLQLTDQRTGTKARYDFEVTLKLPRGMELEKLEIENNAGVLELEDIDLKAESVDISVDAGEAVLEYLHAEKFDIDVGAGTAEIRNLKAEKIEVDCGVGSIDLVLHGSEKDYDYKLECGLGNIEINREGYTSLGKEIKVDNQAGRKVSLNCGVGEIILQTVKE